MCCDERPCVVCYDSELSHVILVGKTKLSAVSVRRKYQQMLDFSHVRDQYPISCSIVVNLALKHIATTDRILE